jgi:cation:H+ antiporter
VGLVMRPRGRVLRVVSWVSVGLLAGWLVNALLMALSGR